MYVKYKILIDESDSNYQAVIHNLRKDSKQPTRGLSWAENGEICISNDLGERWKIQIQGPLLNTRTFSSTPRNTILIKEETKLLTYDYS